MCQSHSIKRIVFNQSIGRAAHAVGNSTGFKRTTDQRCLSGSRVTDDGDKLENGVLESSKDGSSWTKLADFAARSGGYVYASNRDPNGLRIVLTLPVAQPAS